MYINEIREMVCYLLGESGSKYNPKGKLTKVAVIKGTAKAEEDATVYVDEAEHYIVKWDISGEADSYSSRSAFEVWANTNKGFVKNVVWKQIPDQQRK